MKAMILGLSLIAAGCAPLAAQHQADAAFRHALTAHIRGDEETAGRLYREIVALGFDWSGVWNNLAVIAAHKHEYISSRKLLAQAIATNPSNLTALTNYGVMSYHLADLKEARRVLEDAIALRKHTLDRIPTAGRNDYEVHIFERRTAGLADTAQRYLARIANAEITGRAPFATPALAMVERVSF